MFLEYFNLIEQPFGATPDPRFLFSSASHREALASLYTGFYGNRGFTVLIAEPGMGKTTLAFKFLDHIRDRARTVFLFNTLCEPEDMLALILQDLGITPGNSASIRHRQLNEFLAAEAQLNHRVVLVIDEAQNLSTDALEAVRLLTNFETSRSKLMQIVLVGQPQLADKLARPEVSQLLQRISTMCRLVPFSADEIAAYIEYRLKVAGYHGDPLFNSDALRLITESSRGVPRIINTLCFNSLCLCRAHETRLADDSIVAEVIADLQLPTGTHAGTLQSNRVEAASPALIPHFSEVQLSMSRPARYLTAALVCLCTLLAAARWWVAPLRGHLSISFPPTLIQNRVFAAVRALRAPIRVPQSQPSNQDRGAASVEAPRAISPASLGESSQPTKVTVAPGDTLESIATNCLGAYDMTVLQQIRTLNPRITDPNHIQSGRIIRLPPRTGVTTSEVHHGD